MHDVSRSFACLMVRFALMPACDEVCMRAWALMAAMYVPPDKGVTTFSVSWAIFRFE